jgi:hypothetical protein
MGDLDPNRETIPPYEWTREQVGDWLDAVDMGHPSIHPFIPSYPSIQPSTLLMSK